MKEKLQPVYLVCGVSGSGKTWVCKQLTDKYTYIPHDENYKDFEKTIHKASASSAKPVITECPFAERVIKEKLEKDFGVQVIPIFVITPPDQVKTQYEKREGKPLPKAAYTRAGSISKRAEEWSAFHGSAKEVLEELERVADSPARAKALASLMA